MVVLVGGTVPTDDERNHPIMATKARTIISMSADGYRTACDVFVPWANAPRPELLSAWGLTKVLLGSGVLPSGRPISIPVATMREALQRAHGGTVTASEPSTVADPVPSPVPSPAVPDPVPSSGSSVIDALGEFVATIQGQSIDEARVRTIVEEVVASMPSPSHGTVIHVADRPEPVTIDGVVHRRFPHLVDVLADGCAAYLFGPPATGKSHAAEAVAEAIGIPFVGIVACSPDMMPAALRGFVDATGTYQRTAFRDAFEHGGLFVIDEADNAPSAITVGLINTAIASGFLTFPDGTVRKSPEFRCIATANTFGTGPTAEFVGRFPLDPSTLSRFVRLAWGYDENVDRSIVESTGVGHRIADGVLCAVERMRANIDARGLRVFVTVRDARHAALMLRRGWSWDDVVESCLLPAGVTADQRRQIMADVRPVAV